MPSPNCTGAILARKPNVLIREITNGKLGRHYFAQQGLVCLLDFISQHPDFVSNGDFHILDATYTEVLAELETSGFDAKRYRDFYDALIEKRADAASITASLQVYSLSITKGAARGVPRARPLSQRVIQGEAAVIY